MSKPTDEEIIQVLRDHGNCMTYVVTHWLRDNYRGIKNSLRVAPPEKVRGGWQS
ncbi:Uncharacterised protein [Citrobacter freundii]|nr:Uncharacterised protein [Citrobacter freundii]